ncbi:hypothetical protein GCM10009828_030560 [Actinoplanes couchii]|uniref:Uncharacterized protein n=1 Tax=Actinoplanes couchii TaxID=403638 RepID=A0ABQ3XBS7_9ACTN|nr:hypothetical protein Aco03nite_043800 [Actinoplanes couchii]
MSTVARLVSARGRGASVRSAPDRVAPDGRRADGTRTGPVLRAVVRDEAVLVRVEVGRPPAPVRRRVGPWPLGVRRSVISDLPADVSRFW